MINKGYVKSNKTGIILLLVVIIVIVIIIGYFFIDNSVVKHSTDENRGTLIAKTASGEKIDFLKPMPIGFKVTEPPLVSNIEASDLDNDGLLDVIVCDAKDNTVTWIRQSASGKFSESVIAEDLIAPAHVQAYDVDKDGDKDVLVAVLGALFPNNNKIGSIIVLENDGNNNFRKRIIAENIARVSDVRAGDLDGDGDIDLAAAQFGFADGETRWLENLGNWKFKSHIIQRLSGPINVEIVDIDKDGDNDIVSLVSQEWEEIYCFLNDGKGNFKQKLLWGSSNEDYGSSSIFLSDLDGDGDQDVLYTNGDSFNYDPPSLRPWHGVQWLENKGNTEFTFHRICDFGGVYNCKPSDIDKDGDIDLFAVSAFNEWEKPDAKSFIWMENLGKMKFKVREIAKTPTHLITLDVGDFNNDNLIDMVTGGLYALSPSKSMGRVTLWLNNGRLPNHK